MSSESINIFKESVKEYVDISDQIAKASKDLLVVKKKK